MCYVYTIIYLHTVSGIVTFAAFIAVETKIRFFLDNIKRTLKKSLNISPIYLAIYAKDLNNQQVKFFSESETAKWRWVVRCCMLGRLRLKCDGTCAETRFRLSTEGTSPFKSAGASVQSTTGRRAVHISLQCLYCSCKPVFCSHVTLTGYPLHSLVSHSLILPCVTVCHHISTGL